MPHPGGKSGPHFQARILLRTGAMRGEEKVRSWSGRASGVRVYMEGFRVLPYGESRNDWLGLDRDYAERSKDLLAKDIAQALVPSVPTSSKDRPGLLHLPNKNYFGGVFLTQRGAPLLRLLVNREGFVPDAPYEHLAATIRTGIDLTTRVRAMVTAQQRQHRRVLRGKPPEERGANEPPSFMEVLNEAEKHVSEARRLTLARDTKAASVTIDIALDRIRQVTVASDELADQTAMLRVLASVGTQLSSFVHELNGLLGMAEAIEGALLNVVEDVPELHRNSRARLREIRRSVADLRRHVERHASYLIDVVSPDAKRRRFRQRLHARFESATRLVRMAADRRSIDIVNNIPSDVKSPPMFPAELTTVFANLLTNAIKAIDERGRIKATARVTGGGVILRIENTGKAVKVSTSERWFKPFESSTTAIDPTLGQGMGLGLTITRAMLDEYGAAIRFVKPRYGFATALEIMFNGYSSPISTNRVEAVHSRCG